MTPSLWKLIKWVSIYYMTPIGKVANSVVPTSLSSSYKPQLEKYIKKKAKSIQKITSFKENRPKQYLVYKALTKN